MSLFILFDFQFVVVVFVLQHTLCCVSAGGIAVRSAVGVALTDMTNLSPATRRALPFAQDRAVPVHSPAIRKRRCTAAVDYRQPTINS